jgi:molybdopterin molybdotransferase
MVRKMGNMPQKYNLNIQARLGETVSGGKDRVRFQTVRVAEGTAYPIIKESGAITGTAYADGYIIVPMDAVIEKGAEVTVTVF